MSNHPTTPTTEDQAARAEGWLFDIPSPFFGINLTYEGALDYASNHPGKAVPYKDYEGRNGLVVVQYNTPTTAEDPTFNLSAPP